MACPRSQSPLEAELGLTPRALLEPRASPLLGVPKARWLGRPSQPAGGPLPCFGPATGGGGTFAILLKLVPSSLSLSDPLPEMLATCISLSESQTIRVQIPHQPNANCMN